MPHRHLQIALAAATPGMTLSDPVLDTKGNVLLPAGMVLTTALLEGLARHRIALIAIATDIPAAEDAADHARQVARIAHLFRDRGSADAEGGPGPDASAPKPDATDILRQYVLRFRSETAS